MEDRLDVFFSFLAAANKEVAFARTLPSSLLLTSLFNELNIFT